MSLFARNGNASGFVFNLSLPKVEFRNKQTTKDVCKVVEVLKKKKNVRRNAPLFGNIGLQGMLIMQSLDFDSTWITIWNGVILKSLTSCHDTCGWLWVCHSIVKVREKKISWLSNSFWLGLSKTRMSTGIHQRLVAEVVKSTRLVILNKSINLLLGNHNTITITFIWVIHCPALLPDLSNSETAVS